MRLKDNSWLTKGRLLGILLFYYYGARPVNLGFSEAFVVDFLTRLVLVEFPFPRPGQRTMINLRIVLLMLRMWIAGAGGVSLGLDKTMADILDHRTGGIYHIEVRVYQTERDRVGERRRHRGGE